MDVTFDVVGFPVAQQRAGRRQAVSKTGKRYTASYDPPECVNWKRTVKVRSLPYRPNKPSLRAIGVYLVFRLPRPKSLPKRVTEHVRKPDIDNLAKGCLDALRKTFYRDDSQIVILTVEKKYGVPGVTIRLREQP